MHTEFYLTIKRVSFSLVLVVGETMPQNATSAGDSEILTFILALQCFIAFILARAWIEGTIPGIGLVGGVVCYTACLGNWGAPKPLHLWIIVEIRKRWKLFGKSASLS